MAFEPVMSGVSRNGPSPKAASGVDRTIETSFGVDEDARAGSEAWREVREPPSLKGSRRDVCRHGMLEKARVAEINGMMVAGDGIEPPTRGFSIPELAS